MFCQNCSDDPCTCGMEDYGPEDDFEDTEDEEY